MEFKESTRLGLKVIISSLPKGASITALTGYDNFFAVKAGMPWSTLPKAANSQRTLESFKISLGQFLDTIPDKPPSLGYSAEKSNSITDWCKQRGGPRMA
jgi:hypothetical protein